MVFVMIIADKTPLQVTFCVCATPRLSLCIKYFYTVVIFILRNEKHIIAQINYVLLMLSLSLGLVGHIFNSMVALLL